MRRVLFWIHLAIGLTAGLAILLMSVTGVALAGERQLIAWADHSVRSAPPAPGAERLPAERLLARVGEQAPGLTPSAIAIASDPQAPVVISAGTRTILADAYTGALLGESAPRMRRFMTAARAWHRWLALEGSWRPLGRAITGWSNLIFLGLVLSGLYLWLPRVWAWRQLQPRLLPRRGARGKARDFNWHHVAGAWSAIPLAIIVIAAVPMSFPAANALVYRLAGDAPPAARGSGRDSRPATDAGRRAARTDRAAASLAGVDAALRRAAVLAPGWRTITLRLPGSADAPLVFTIDQGSGGQPQRRSTVTIARTGDVLSNERFSDLSPGRRLRTVLRFAHTGEILGPAGQVIAGAATTGAVVLACTGLMLSFRRWRAWQTRRPLPHSVAARSAAHTFIGSHSS
jgi:uncharacterized iron-regulated membrane protein